jgi:hypothetical protein
MFARRAFTIVTYVNARNTYVTYSNVYDARGRTVREIFRDSLTEACRSNGDDIDKVAVLMYHRENM